MQLKPGVQASAAELIDFVREQTPERATVPVNAVFIDPMPLTAVGKVFKPALRWDVARRVFAQTLAPVSMREPLAKQILERLDPFALRHRIEWR